MSEIVNAIISNCTKPKWYNKQQDTCKYTPFQPFECNALFQWSSFYSAILILLLSIYSLIKLRSILQIQNYVFILICNTCCLMRAFAFTLNYYDSSLYKNLGCQTEYTFNQVTILNSGTQEQVQQKWTHAIIKMGFLLYDQRVLADMFNIIIYIVFYIFVFKIVEFWDTIYLNEINALKIEVDSNSNTFTASEVIEIEYSYQKIQRKLRKDKYIVKIILPMWLLLNTVYVVIQFIIVHNEKPSDLTGLLTGSSVTAKTFNLVIDTIMVYQFYFVGNSLKNLFVEEETKFVQCAYKYGIKAITFFLIIRILNEDIAKGVVDLYDSQKLEALELKYLEGDNVTLLDLSFVLNCLLPSVLCLTILGIHWQFGRQQFSMSVITDNEKAIFSQIESIQNEEDSEVTDKDLDFKKSYITRKTEGNEQGTILFDDQSQIFANMKNRKSRQNELLRQMPSNVLKREISRSVYSKSIVF